MRKLYVMAISLIAIVNQSSSQQNDSTLLDSKITLFDDLPDSTFYSGINQIWNANVPVSYLSFFPKFFPLEKRKTPLIFGEGMNGFIVEAQTDLQFTIAQGRRLYSNHFWQTLKFSIRYAPGLRMTMDNSSNVLPTNQKIGIQIDKLIWDSYTKNGYKGNRIESYDVSKKNWAAQTEPLHLLYLTTIAMHYSNGQAEGVWLDQAANRNDYIKGDFSTNLLSLSLNYCYYNNHLLSASLGYQRDGNWFGPFSFIPEQKNRYGQNRLIGFLQYKSKPVPNPFRRRLNYFYEDENNDTIRFTIDPKWEWRIRAEYDLIVGNVSNYVRNHNYRLGTHLFVEGFPLRSRAISYLIHVYYGRDYFNIRYDDPVLAVMGGLAFTINRYKNPRFRPSQAIVSRPSTRTKLEEKILNQKK